MAIDEKMNAEWVAWREMCEQLKELGIDINKDSAKPFVCAIRLWGERLYALREYQSQQIIDDALNEAFNNYAPHSKGLA